jgi:hypothetical protein
MNHKIIRFLETRYTINKLWKITKVEITKPKRILYSKIVLLFEYKIINNKFFFQGQIYIPEGKLSKYQLVTCGWGAMVPATLYPAIYIWP